MQNALHQLLATLPAGRSSEALALTDYCTDAFGQPNGECPACNADTECVIVSNSCHDIAHCTHEATNLVVDQIGCNYAYDVPSDDVCRFVASVCPSE